MPSTAQLIFTSYYKIINILPPNQFGKIYIIVFPIGGYNMVQHESFEMATIISRLRMTGKYPQTLP